MNEAVTGQQHGDLIVGARGWVHANWQESFYPEDIPDDWRLDYYANEFDTLLVPWAQWQDGVAELAAALEDVEEGFHLYLELPARVQALPELATVAGRVSGLVCREADAGAWQEQAGAAGLPLLAQTPVEATAEAYAPFGETAETVGLVLLNTQAAGLTDLMAMRGEVEKLLPLMGERMDMIFVDAAPDIEAMRNTRTLAELLGA